MIPRSFALPALIRNPEKEERFLRLLTAWSALVLLFGLSACASPGKFPVSAKGSMGKLMVERLGWMDEVARVKKARSLPVDDPVREAQLLDAMETLAVASNLPAAPVRKFFSGQIVAAKERQKEWLRENASLKQAPQSVPDLGKTIRPALDRIGQQMISALIRARESEDPRQVVDVARLRLQKDGYSQAVVTPAIEGLEAGLHEK